MNYYYFSNERDLKPTNIYISADDNSLAIGDFGVVTVMKDVRTKTRGSVGKEKVWLNRRDEKR